MTIQRHVWWKFLAGRRPEHSLRRLQGDLFSFRGCLLVSVFPRKELFLVKSKGKIISCGTLRNHPPGSGDSHEQRLPQLLELLLLHGTHLHRGLGGGPWLLWDSLHRRLPPWLWKLHQWCYLRVCKSDLTRTGKIRFLVKTVDECVIMSQISKMNNFFLATWEW